MRQQSLISYQITTTQDRRQKFCKGNNQKRQRLSRTSQVFQIWNFFLLQYMSRALEDGRVTKPISASTLRLKHLSLFSFMVARTISPLLPALNLFWKKNTSNFKYWIRYKRSVTRQLPRLVLNILEKINIRKCLGFSPFTDHKKRGNQNNWWTWRWQRWRIIGA